jgi:nucleoside-diphosphate-sugar epimerase
VQKLLPDLRDKVGAGLLEYSPGGMRMPQKGALDITRAGEEVGYAPTVSLKEGMRHYIEYIRSLALQDITRTSI